MSKGSRTTAKTEGGDSRQSPQIETPEAREERLARAAIEIAERDLVTEGDLGDDVKFLSLKQEPCHVCHNGDAHKHPILRHRGVILSLGLEIFCCMRCGVISTAEGHLTKDRLHRLRQEARTLQIVSTN